MKPETQVDSSELQPRDARAGLIGQRVGRRFGDGTGHDFGHGIGRDSGHGPGYGTSHGPGLGRGLGFGRSVGHIRRAGAYGRVALLAVAIVTLNACTAARVVTHSVDTEFAKVPAGDYHMDADHWSIVFDVEHLKYSRFTMRFDRAKATLHLDPATPANSSVKVSIDAASIDTNVKALDKITTGESMLDVANSPAITFESTGFELTGPSTGTLTGNLTIRGKTAPVTLDVVFNGAAPNPLTREPTVGFGATGTFSRSSFGMTTYYPAVGNEIHVSIQAEFEQPAPGAAASTPAAN